MNRVFLSLAALAMLASPSLALTLQEAQAELAGMNCAGSTCSASVTKETTVNLPDVVTSKDVQISPARSWSGQDHSGRTYSQCTMKTMNGGVTLRPNVNADCTPQSIYTSSGGSTPAVMGKVETITPGGTETVYSCSTTTKELSYNGPNTDRAGAWSVSSSESSSSGAC